MSAPHETPFPKRRPSALRAGSGVELEPTDVGGNPHQALLALARLLGRQAAIETMRSTPATT